MVRRPAVAGQFYPAAPERLRAEIERCLVSVEQKENALGVLAPHAGYMYSGPVAGELYSRIAIPDTVVILAPNHTGFGTAFSVWPSGSWETPLGSVPIDEELTNALLEATPLALADTSAHQNEHSAEVQVPFLQYLNPNVSIVAVVIAEHDRERLIQFGLALAETIRKLRPDTLVVASSDMSHFESQAVANKLDQMALDRVLALDEEGLWRTVRQNRISMCGVSPAVCMLACAKRLGAKEATLVRYQTSGDVTGDYLRVVGYAAVIVK